MSATGALESVTDEAVVGKKKYLYQNPYGIGRLCRIFLGLFAKNTPLHVTRCLSNDMIFFFMTFFENSPIFQLFLHFGCEKRSGTFKLFIFVYILQTISI